MIYNFIFTVISLIYLFLFFSFAFYSDLKILGIGSLIASFLTFPLFYKFLIRKHSLKKPKLIIFAISVGIFCLFLVANTFFLFLENPDQNKLIINQSKLESFNLSNVDFCSNRNVKISFNKRILEVSEFKVSGSTRFIDLKPKYGYLGGISVYCNKYEESDINTFISKLRTKVKEDKNFRVDQEFEFVIKNSEIKNQFSYINEQKYLVCEILLSDNSSYIIEFQTTPENHKKLIEESLFKIEF
jgi:hypothetical protein